MVVHEKSSFGKKCLTQSIDVFRPTPSAETETLPNDWFIRFGTGPSVAPDFTTIIAGFVHFARMQPEETAVCFGKDQMTYGALDRASNRLAHVLHATGVGHGDSVCIFLTRSIPMVVAIVAAMKVGASYAPQHFGVAPVETLSFVGRATQAKVILTLAQFAPDVPSIEGQRVIAIDDVIADGSLPDAPMQIPTQADDICMVLFTSGTTGSPNGVQVTHRNLANILLTSPGNLGITPGKRVGQILSIAFDMAAWEILGCMANGGTLVIRGKSIQQTAEDVDVLIATPSILGGLDATRCGQVKTVAVAGEPCPRPLADLWSRFCTFYNSCGPTETTIINTAIRHTPDKKDLTIGTPTPNNTVYILDDAFEPIAFGEKGVMWAGGDCVTAGYIGNPTLTTERYRPDPYRPGHMMFNTRDLGRWTAHGELRHCGRVDDLVKIRGFRVELDGVSRQLERAVGCEQAVTLKYDDRTLVAFVRPVTVSPQDAVVNVEATLPYYCVPEIVIPMDTLPKTSRGKLDKRSLLALATQHLKLKNPPEAAE